MPTTSKYPLVLFVFMRPATAEHFMALARDSGIRKMYLFGDGARRPEEKEETTAVITAVRRFQKANPQISYTTRFSKHNLGLKRNITEGLDTVFRHEEAAIILEDDCVPSPDFFRFAAEMLSKYESNRKVMSINGTSMGGKMNSSYSFTRYPQCWGWATWKRAWKNYDRDLKSFSPSAFQTLAKKLEFNPLLKWYWRTMLVVVKARHIDTWDFQWSYTHFTHQGLAIVPSANLIQNVGFDAVATNTKTKTGAARMRMTSLTWPLSHPARVVENLSVTKQIEASFYTNPVAVLGLLRQYMLWKLGVYAPRT